MSQWPDPDPRFRRPAPDDPTARQGNERQGNEQQGNERLADDAPVEAEGVDEPEPQRDWQLPLLLFVATCYSTYKVTRDRGGTVNEALLYAFALMLILTLHELGHFFQAVRYRVPTSFPFFIPMPFSPIGTMGAVIGMFGRHGNRRELFDIGITGPLAGLVPTLVFSIWGLLLSEVHPVLPVAGNRLGEPLLFKGLIYLMFGPMPPGHDLYLHPIAFAGWVGLLITSLNLIPIGQLDGGHILYALLREKAHFVGQTLLMAAVAGVVLLGKWEWTLMLVILMVLGRTHPATANDDIPLGAGRTIVGWLTLAFIPIGFTPSPFQ